jgi:protein involved in polysaccharide export with SLBB domain
VSACASESKVRLDEPYSPPLARALESRSEFAPGDAIEVEYSRNFPAIEAYPLGVGDALEIEVYSHPDLSLTTTVAPDGTISYHHIGTIPAAGRTIEDLRAHLAKALTEVVPNPVVSVFLQESDVRVARFLELLLRHPTGALREVKIGAEGTVSLPGIGRVSIAGLTAEQTQNLLNERLHAALPTLSVYVALKTQADDVFTVWGEVMKPGRYAMQGELTLLDALAIAGGPTPYAELDKIVLMNYPVNGEPAVAQLYNLADALEHGQSLAGVLMRPRDAVLVMRSGIGDVNTWIDQYIRRNLPFNIGLTYRLNP